MILLCLPSNSPLAPMPPLPPTTKAMTQAAMPQLKFWHDAAGWCPHCMVSAAERSGFSFVVSCMCTCLGRGDFYNVLQYHVASQERTVQGTAIGGAVGETLVILERLGFPCHSPKYTDHVGFFVELESEVFTSG